MSCAEWNDARKGVYLKPLFKTPCSNCYWGWNIPIMLDYRDISLMQSVPLMWGPVTASPVGIEPMTIFGGAPPPPYNWYPIHNGENSMNSVGWPPNTPLSLCWSTENSGSWRYLSWFHHFGQHGKHRSYHLITWLSHLGFGSGGGEGSFYLHHYLTQPFRVWLGGWGGIILLTSLLDSAI